MSCNAYSPLPSRSYLAAFPVLRAPGRVAPFCRALELNNRPLEKIMTMKTIKMKKIGLFRHLGLPLLLASSAASADWYVDIDFNLANLRNATNDRTDLVANNSPTAGNPLGTGGAVLGSVDEGFIGTGATGGLDGSSTIAQESKYRTAFDSDSFLAIAVGKTIDRNWRADLEYHHAKFEDAAPEANGDALEKQMVFFNAWRNLNFDFLEETDFDVYVGGGLGFGKLSQGSLDDRFAAAQFGTGVSYQLTDSLYLKGEYLYTVGEPNPTLENSNTKIFAKVRGESLSVGLRYHFGEE